jgi:tyrosyl-tRNA synthetase
VAIRSVALTGFFYFCENTKFMNFIEELRWRGMLQDATPGVEDLLQQQSVTGYIGFDPTAPSMTIGNYVPLMLLTLFQQAGHHPIILMGGATGRIGDPSGKDKERDLKSYEELDANLAHQMDQVRKLLAFEGVDNPARIINNHDFYRDMNVLTFLRDIGKTLTVNYMMSKEAVKKRIEVGISFTEFSYQLLQAYDFQRLYETHHCVLQMGGSDQWGNITSGTEFIRRNLGAHAYALTAPLLTKSDGRKFGKSEEGNIWLDPSMTSPYKFYQFWINCDDRDLPTFTRYFTLRSREEAEALEAEHADNPNALKRLLAEELTVRIHSRTEYESVLQVSELLFNKNASRETLLALPESTLHQIGEEVPAFKIPRDLLASGVNIVDLMAEHTDIVTSKGEARKAIKNNAVSLNKQKITSHEFICTTEHLLHGQFLMVENGKRNKYMIQVHSG